MTVNVERDFLPYKYLMVFLKYLLVVQSAFLVIIVFGNVVGRYAFNFSLAWAEEASRFLFIWVILIGSVLANEKYEHMNLDILVQYLPRRGGRFVQLIAQVVMLAVLAIIFRGGLIVTLEDITLDVAGPRDFLRRGLRHRAFLLRRDVLPDPRSAGPNRESLEEGDELAWYSFFSSAFSASSR